MLPIHLIRMPTVVTVISLALFGAFARASDSATQPSTTELMRQILELRREVDDLRTEIALLKKAIVATPKVESASDEDKFRESMRPFLRIARAIGERLKTGVAFSEYDRKVSELSDAFSEIREPPSTGRCADAKITAEKIFDAHKTVRDAWRPHAQSKDAAEMWRTATTYSARNMIWTDAIAETEKLRQWVEQK